jgi:hypothetical protein
MVIKHLNFIKRFYSFSITFNFQLLFFPITFSFYSSVANAAGRVIFCVITITCLVLLL